MEDCIVCKEKTFSWVSVHWERSSYSSNNAVCLKCFQHVDVDSFLKRKVMLGFDSKKEELNKELSKLDEEYEQFCKENKIKESLGMKTMEEKT
ncbi:MAG: hypothetical protein Q7R52_02425 [archaeon]|nr:hypothetical protein [archaeon]